jgi:hypothetical protein
MRKGGRWGVEHVTISENHSDREGLGQRECSKTEVRRRKDEAALFSYPGT